MVCQPAFEINISVYVWCRYFGNVVTNDARCTREIKCRIAMLKIAFNKKKTVFTRKLDINLMKNLMKCYIWSIAFYVVEIWTFWKVDY